MVFNSEHFDERYFETSIVIAPPIVRPVPPLIIMRRRPLRQVPFTKRLIIFGRIRRHFTQQGSVVGRIRRFFADDVVFSSTTVKHIEEEVFIVGFVMRDRKEKSRRRGRA